MTLLLFFFFSRAMCQGATATSIRKSRIAYNNDSYLLVDINYNWNFLNYSSGFRIQLRFTQDPNVLAQPSPAASGAAL